MSNTNFKIAMANIIHVGPYFPPRLDASNKGCEWLIVRRWGEEGQFLEISDTHGPSPEDCLTAKEAPEKLTAKNSMLGLLVREEKDKSVFLLVRRNETKEVLSGKYYPVDGFAAVNFSDGASLNASGRHAHNKQGGDNPNPQPGEPAMSWHFDARKVAWSGEK